MNNSLKEILNKEYRYRVIIPSLFCIVLSLFILSIDVFYAIITFFILLLFSLPSVIGDKIKKRKLIELIDKEDYKTTKCTIIEKNYDMSLNALLSYRLRNVIKTTAGDFYNVASLCFRRCEIGDEIIAVCFNERLFFEDRENTTLILLQKNVIRGNPMLK